MREWQPIETAPKDGTMVILAGFSGGLLNEFGVGEWDSGDWTNEAYTCVTKPTHWMQLPKPPAIAMETGTAIDSEAGAVAKP